MNVSYPKIFRLSFGAAVFLLLFFMGSLAHAQEETISRNAMVVYNLTQFVVWPGKVLEGDASDCRFCLLGDDLIGPEIERLCQEQPHGGNAQFRTLDELAGAKDCHLLYIGADWSSRLSEIFGAVGDHPVLTVSSVPGFARQGGMVEILSAADRVHFQINLDAVKGTGLIIDAPLLQIANVIRMMK